MQSNGTGRLGCHSGCDPRTGYPRRFQNASGGRVQVGQTQAHSLQIICLTGLASILAQGTPWKASCSTDTIKEARSHLAPELYKPIIIGEIMKMRTALIGATAFCMSSAAYAAELPRYDPNSYCESVSAVSGGSAMITNECIKMEQTAYNNLKRIWESVPSKTSTYCDRVARTTGGSYSILESCIEMEISESGAPQKFQF